MALEEDYDFRVISLDRDVGDKQPYSGIATGVWRQFPGGNVMYLDAQRIRSDLVKLLTTEHFDAWYANSFFDPCFSILPAVLRNTKLRGDIPMIVAPRGEFNPGALSLKGARKRIYLTISRLLNIYRGTYWHATNGIEQEQVSRLMNIGPGDVFLVNNFGAASAGYSRIEQKRVGRLRIIFVGRIVRIKNLLFALRVLSSASKGVIQLDIFGPIEDTNYWAECTRQMQGLPRHVLASYRGEAPPDEIARILASYDLFMLPSAGENFGHSISEALTAGVPALISDRTPWRGLEASGAGWDLSLDRPELFTNAVNTLVDMDAPEWNAMSLAARAFSETQMGGINKLRDGYRNMFGAALSRLPA
jgi:glycosyltransferase involved in cell wall biosynthesis